MIRFTNDYSEGCHPAILAALSAANLEGNFGYGTDPHCTRARGLIRDATGAPEADVHFLVGGTQVNATAICAFLRPHQAVLATTLGHVCGHETGAVEATGHKCVALPCGTDGKLAPQAIRDALAAHTNEHNVQPKLVYISSTTETGGVYTADELYALRETCDALGLYLYLDGARLASALAAGGAPLTVCARCCDAFTIGGTKNGALFGEALCILNDALKPDFRYILKQRGGMLAKGFLLGLQFEALMENGLYQDLGRRSTALALRLRDGMQRLGVEFACDSPSNQQFPILPNAVLDELRGRFHWEEMGPRGVQAAEIRLVTSWATQDSAVDAFLEALADAFRQHAQAR